MISLCTVVLAGMEKTWAVLIDSILKKTKLITEVVIVQVDEGEEKTWHERGITFRKFNHFLPVGLRLHGHALGLHRCIELAQEEYIMFCDPDVFFYTNIEEFYLNVMDKNSLDVVGVSHHAATNQAYSYFPCIMNMLVKKKDLPDNNFLKNELKLRTTILRNPDGEPDPNSLDEMEGKYLTVGPIPNYIDEFPNKNLRCNFDVGCNLYLWAKQQNWKWLSFQTLDCHVYTTKYYRGNIKLPKLENKKLLYHMTTSTLAENSDKFQIEYKRNTDD